MVFKNNCNYLINILIICLQKLRNLFMHDREVNEPEDIYISVPWGHIAGRWYGNRNVRPILALHGWQDNLGTWDRLMPLLPYNIGILCIDFPGHGRSSRYPNGIAYHMIDYVHTIMTVVKKYKWQKVSLLGHSMGGIVSFIYASLYPHMVDMLIELDIIVTPIRTNEYVLQKLVIGTEKLLIENERLLETIEREPPSFTYEELQEKIFNGSNKSVLKQFSEHLFKRSIKPSQLFDGKYYISRDGRIKYYHEFNASLGLLEGMTKRLLDINYMVIRAKSSKYVTDEMLCAVQKIHRKMEFYEVEGTHHVHLNSPEKIAEIIIPFILKNRPDIVDKNSLSVKVISKL